MRFKATHDDRQRARNELCASAAFDGCRRQYRFARPTCEILKSLIAPAPRRSGNKRSVKSVRPSTPTPPPCLFGLNTYRNFGRTRFSTSARIIRNRAKKATKRIATGERRGCGPYQIRLRRSAVGLRNRSPAERMTGQDLLLLALQCLKVSKRDDNFSAVESIAICFLVRSASTRSISLSVHATANSWKMRVTRVASPGFPDSCVLKLVDDVIKFRRGASQNWRGESHSVKTKASIQPEARTLSTSKRKSSPPMDSCNPREASSALPVSWVGIRYMMDPWKGWWKGERAMEGEMR
ncbi:hypothetical protein EVAR_6153_1 [Eumeta japonica]|uniref:Uncharacterized protein n=1 Tax=Eumeta variegata TaxID=151549 RepID=A0A4C1THC1_EUMVA|nr:hypothetical protein EVAR_6153_1 [Eumeta japonica]